MAWLELVDLNAGVGKTKRLGQIVPIGRAAEVCDLDRIPLGRLYIERGKARSRIVALLDDLTTSGFDRQPLGVDVEHGHLPWAGKRRRGDVLATCVEGHSLSQRGVGPAAHGPERSAKDNLCG